jgi:hypothetical protein
MGTVPSKYHYIPIHYSIEWVLSGFNTNYSIRVGVFLVGFKTHSIEGVGFQYTI